jgi:stress response protein SCP2
MMVDFLYLKVGEQMDDNITIRQGDRVQITCTKIRVDLVERHQIVEVDLSAFVLAKNKKFLVHPDDNKGEYACIRRYFVFFNNEETPDNAVKFIGDTSMEDDHLEGGEFAALEMLVDLERLNFSANQIVFSASTDFIPLKESGEKEDWCQNNTPYIRICTQENDEEICRFFLTDDFSGKDCIEMGRLVRDGNSWEFEATGIGYDGGLSSLVNKFKVEDWG